MLYGLIDACASSVYYALRVQNGLGARLLRQLRHVQLNYYKRMPVYEPINYSQ